MKIVIEIPEEDYKNGTLINYFKVYSTELDKIIYDGTPLEAQPTSDDELIKALKAVRTIHNGNYAPQIDEAIRRLEAQPTDAVSREQALLALTGMDLPTDRDKLIALFTNRIQNLPSVTPRTNLAKTSQDCISILNRIMEYTYGMLTAEKIGLQHLIESIMDEMSGGGEDEEEHDS